MRHFPNILSNVVAALALITVSSAATSASAGDTVRTAGLRGYESHKPSDNTGTKGQLAANCVTVSTDRAVGAQRVWTQHGMISVGGHVESVRTTECR